MTAFSDAENTLRTCISDALDLLDQERRVFLSGAYDQIARITEVKLEILERLEASIRVVPKTPDLLELLRHVIDMSRRNEQIIGAARQGFLFARRKIGRIKAATSGAVAYAEDGSLINSTADMLGAERLA